MYVIIITFLLSTGTGEAATADRFATIDACEMARADRVEQFKRIIEANHEITITSSYCGLPSSLGSTGI